MNACPISFAMNESLPIRITNVHTAVEKRISAPCLIFSHAILHGRPGFRPNSILFALGQPHYSCRKYLSYVGHSHAHATVTGIHGHVQHLAHIYSPAYHWQAYTAGSTGLTCGNGHSGWGVVRSRLSCHVPGKWGQETEGCPGVTMGSGG